MRHTDYDEIAATYDRRYSEEDYSGIQRALMEFIDAAPMGVLEVGCGTGHWLKMLLPLRAVGVDQARSMLLHARSKLPTSPLVQARAEDLPFENGSFDRLFTINAHHHFSDKQQFLKEARRVLAPGGSVMTVALDPHTGADQWWVYDYFDGTLAIDKERYPSCGQIRDWMSNAGFTETYSCEVQHEADDVAADAALQRGMITPSYTSQLAVLTRDEFSAGMKRIQAGLAKDNNLRLCADLRVYATYGRSPQ